MGYVHTEISSPFITIQKDEGIQSAAIPLHFLFTFSQSLLHNHIDCLQYNTNTIPNRITMFFFYRGNTMGKYYGYPNTMGPQNYWPTNTPKWGNECTINLGYKHKWIISLDLEDQAPKPTFTSSIWLVATIGPWFLLWPYWYFHNQVFLPTII